jgi:fusaric acid resistance family protein
MKTALACSLAIWITYTYAWPGPYWSCLAIVISRHAEKSASWFSFSKQGSGVAFGTFVGIATLTVSQNAFLFCLLFAVWTGFVAYRCTVAPPVAPFYRFAGLAATNVAMNSLFQDNPEVNVALIRGAQILLGIVLATLVNLKPNYREERAVTSLKPANEPSHRLALRHAGRVVVVMFVALTAWLWFDIPYGTFGVVIATLIVTSAIDSAAIRFSQRMLGIFLGAGLAVVFTVLFLPHMERIQEFELVVFGIFWLCSFINYRSPKYAFIGLQASITFAVVLIRDPHQSSDLLPIWQRGKAIAVGLVLSFLAMDLLTRKTIREPALSQLGNH